MREMQVNITNAHIIRNVCGVWSVCHNLTQPTTWLGVVSPCTISLYGKQF